MSSAKHLANDDRLEAKYRSVFNKILLQKKLAREDVAKSRFFFSTHNNTLELSTDGKAIPKKFDTYGIVCCLPFPNTLQQTLEDLWNNFLEIIGHPLAYGVEPANRHVEIFLFQRPEELFNETEIKAGVERSFDLAKTIKPFKITFSYPFITPDGTIVVPGYDTPQGTIDSFRTSLQQELTSYPKKQSQWLHTSLGRILEPLDSARLAPLLSDMKKNWGKRIGEVNVQELLWTHEKQWYMLDKVVLKNHTLNIV